MAKLEKKSGKKGLIRFLFVVCCIFVSFLGAKFLLKYLGNNLQTGEGVLSTVNFLSRSIGTDLQKDSNGNVNMLLVGIGGKQHNGGMLADTIIVSSFDTVNNSVSMLSIPRDLYVRISGYQGKLNSLFSVGYARGNLSVASGAELLTEKVEEIVGFDIPYYVIVDFHGFEKFIDAIGGINIDVPETIHDTEYPVSEEGDGQYGTFYIQAGPHTLDGATALKYARSRHSTSDFSRSLRQQQIIKAVKERVTSSDILTPSMIKQFYNSYQEMITTNFSLQELLGSIRYLKKKLHISSFGLNVSFVLSSFARTQAGSFLFFPSRDDFGGAAVILPYGASVNTVSFYDYINNFAQFILHDQKFLSEQTTLTIKNGIHKKFAQEKKMKYSGWANAVAVKLKRFGFAIDAIDNSDIKLMNTTLVLPFSGTGNTQSYSGFLSALQKIIPVVDVVNASATDTGVVHMELILGDNFIQYIAKSGFNYTDIF